MMSRELNIDEIDRKLLQELYADSSASVPALSEKINANTSVLYSRIRRLVRKGAIRKFTIEIDDTVLGMLVKATVGINRDPKMKEAIHDELMKAKEVVSVTEVTGRFDMMIRIYAGDLDSLHETVIGRIGKIPGICNTETFVELEKASKDEIILPGGH